MVDNKSTTDEEMHRVEAIVSTLLRIGVLLSAAIILIGLLLLMFTGTSGYPGTTYPTTLTAIFDGIAQFKPYAIVMFGLFCLILTPVLRVLVSFVTFLKEKDYLYVAITSIVLIILTISFLIGTTG
ncbi:DUF1634 domain-containing protein [Listeria booriae]|uniref:DUF1634 domain-containing protein n=1 Tax=Listeria booriae TaxID=1552123 RepID=UPI001626B9DA|nr:DUF1634 domain-containing protein [Listeria booriae]MBC1513973.1 DUF1634 domain-containing protein [Listeria booriae]MBC6153070.1 DUF1634 domain-containing protein [Listeria booriae]MBC6307389.1 DUF1634 domain-containing protein [Listeria booriae]